MTKIIISRSTGFLGNCLSNCLENNNYELIITSFIKNLLDKFLLDTYTNDNLKEYGYSYTKHLILNSKVFIY